MQTYVGLSINNRHWRPRGGWTIKKKFLDILFMFRGLISCWQKRGKWEPLVHSFVRSCLGFLLSESSPSRDFRHAGVGVMPSAQHPRLLTSWTCKGTKLYKINACFCDANNTKNYITVSMFSAVSCCWVLYWTASSVCWIVVCKKYDMLFTGCFCTAALFRGQMATTFVVTESREKQKLQRSLPLQAPQLLPGWVPCCDLAN